MTKSRTAADEPTAIDKMLDDYPLTLDEACTVVHDQMRHPNVLPSTTDTFAERIDLLLALVKALARQQAWEDHLREGRLSTE